MVAATPKILVIGGTGTIGKFMVEASAKAGHPTIALVRGTTRSNPAKSPIIQKFKSLGVNLVLGDVHDHQSLVKAIKQVDVVISAVSYLYLPDQYKIISAIKEAGNVQYKEIIETKAKIHRAVEDEGIPHTYVVANFFASHSLPTLSQLGATTVPRDKIIILGDGNSKVIFNAEEDIASYTIKTIDNPRTLNKILYIKHSANTLSFNELVSLWEKKIGKTLERVYVLEEQVLKQIQASSFPTNMALAMMHTTYVKGDHTNYEIDRSLGVLASELYPDVKYTTVDEYLNQFV